jgi:hypothetical protein
MMQEFFQTIRDLMVNAYGILVREAQGRIVTSFRNHDCTSVDTEDLVSHRDVDYWAANTYYGPDAIWQAKLGREPKPRPWP